jgi:hypothetical protein
MSVVIQKILQYGHALMRQPYAGCCEHAYDAVVLVDNVHSGIIAILKSLQSYNKFLKYASPREIILGFLCFFVIRKRIAEA